MNYRVMTAADLPALTALFAQAFGDPEPFAERVFTAFAGPENVWLAEQDGQPAAMLCAVPVEHKGRRGAYLYGVATRPDCRRQGLATGLIAHAAAQLSGQGAQFLCLIPQKGEPGLFDWYAKQGFEKAFALRRLRLPVKRNLWAQAEFDTVTAKRLYELRGKFCPDSVRLDPARTALVLGDLYQQGVTIVSSPEGYGLYFRKGETLYFPELQAASDRAALQLLQAAREKEVVVEDAEITVGAEQPLFACEGCCEDYGMIKFLAEPFDVSGTYLRLMLDE